jgi:hypothetical protein
MSIDPGPESGAVTALTAAMRLLDIAKLQGLTFQRVATGDDGRRGDGRYRAICDADFLCEFDRAGLGAVPDVRTVSVIVSGPPSDLSSDAENTPNPAGTARVQVDREGRR